eukprot:179826_1
MIVESDTSDLDDNAAESDRSTKSDNKDKEIRSTSLIEQAIITDVDNLNKMGKKKKKKHQKFTLKLNSSSVDADNQQSRTPNPINTSQSATTSPRDDRPLTFPTMSLNTDNASKISKSTPHHQSFKVLLIGQSRVGKTAIVRRFVKDKFMSSYKMTLGASQWHFKCEVPIDLIEEIPQDQNMVRSMTSFLHSINENEKAELAAELAEDLNYNKEVEKNTTASFGIAHSVDPFEDDDKNAEFGDGLYNDYQLPNMDDIHDNDALNPQTSNDSNHHKQSSSITDYGTFTTPDITLSSSENKDIRKVSMKLQISLQIIDTGFHPTEEELFDGVNAIILVADYTQKGSIAESIEKYERFLKNSPFFGQTASKYKRGRDKKKRKSKRSRGS